MALSAPGVSSRRTGRRSDGRRTRVAPEGITTSHRQESPEEPDDITHLLHRWQAGDSAAEAVLFEALLPDLRKMAQRYFRRENVGHTLQPTALVNEAFLRLSRGRNIEWHDRSHFFAIAGRVMRRYLIDYARARPGVKVIALDGVPERMMVGKTNRDLALEIDILLDELDRENRQQCSVVELRFFLGLTDGEAAEALNLSLHTLQREWYRARHWLFERLAGSEPLKAKSLVPSVDGNTKTPD